MDTDARAPAGPLTEGRAYVVLAPADTGCWRIVAASRVRIARERADEEVLVVDLVRNSALVAYENRGPWAWCFDDPARNLAGYTPCFSALAERKSSAKWLGAFLSDGKVINEDSLRGVSDERVRHALDSVPNFRHALREALDGAKSSKNAARGTTAHD